MSLLRMVICLLLGFSCLTRMHAQTCAKGSFIRGYKGTDNHYVQQAFRHADGDLQVVGNTDNNTNVISGSGWLTRITASGTLIWSRRYERPGFNQTSFYDALPTPDGGTVAVGTLTDIIGGTVPSIVQSLLVRTDRYGTIRDARTLDNSSQLKEATIFNSIIPLSGGGYLIGGLQFDRIGLNTRMLFVRVSEDFKIVWQTKINSPTFNFRIGFRNAMRQLSDGNVAAGMLFDSEIASGRINKVGFLFLHLDMRSGRPIWMAPYVFYSKPASNFIATATIAQIYETGAGATRWLLSYSDSVLINQRPYVAKSAQLDLDASGTLVAATAFTHQGPGSRAIAGAGNGNKPLWLMDDGIGALLVENEGASLLRQQFYDLKASSPTTMVAAPDGGMYLLGSGTTDNTLFTITKTNPQLQVNCGMGAASVQTSNVKSAFVNEAADFTAIAVGDLNFPLPTLPITSRAETLTTSDLCPLTCCTEQRGVTDLQLCGNKPITLPGGLRVTAAGSYYEKISLPSGCDSLAVYEVRSVPDPFAVTLDTFYCLDAGDTLELKVPGGFDRYEWEGLSSTDSTAVVRQPGNYRLTVSGSCGTATYAFRVQEGCNTEVWLPNAFTPNGDGRNDVWRYPALNRQKLVRLAVYDRWGGLVFQTSNAEQGWDGRSGTLALPTGVYVYVATVRNSKGQTSIRKGTVTLIR